jgi:hypothetical protein
MRNLSRSRCRESHHCYMFASPTEWEKENCEHITMTSDEPWDPTLEDWEESEAKFTRKHRHARSITSTKGETVCNCETNATSSCSELEQEIHKHFFDKAPRVRTVGYATSRAAKSGKRKLDVDYERLRRILGLVPMEVVEKTIQNTMQLAGRNAEMPIHRCFKTKFSALRLKRLDCVVYSDTFASNVTSTRGNNKTQGFVCGDAFYLYHYPMRSKKGAADGLQKFMLDVGSPRQIHTDNAKVETQATWRKIANDAWARCSTTEPYTLKQNKCEHEFGAARIHARVIMETTKCPEQLWDYVLDST